MQPRLVAKFGAGDMCQPLAGCIVRAAAQRQRQAFGACIERDAMIGGGAVEAQRELLETTLGELQAL